MKFGARMPCGHLGNRFAISRSRNHPLAKSHIIMYNANRFCEVKIMSDTIAAISTPVAAGGIGVIRISGDDAIAIADKAFNATSGKKLSTLKGYTAAHGRIHIDGEDIDEGVALVFRSPKSYTGEDTVEISCHGGVFVTNQVLRAVLSAPVGGSE